MADGLMQNSSKDGEINKVIGENLRLVRNAFQMTQADVANRLGVSTQQIHKYETGKNNITSQKLAELSKLFGCDMEFFLSHEAAKAGEQVKNNAMLAVSENKKKLTSNKKRKHTDAIDLLKVYMTLSDNEKQQVKDLIEKLRSCKGCGSAQ